MFDIYWVNKNGILTVLSTLFIKTFSAVAGSAKANGREPKTGLGRVFNYKLGCYDDLHVLMYVVNER